MHKHLQSYLEEIESELRYLPAASRDAELKEIHHHLSLLIEANIEQGQSEEQAVTIALQQFGKPKAIGRELLRACKIPRETPLRVLLIGIGTYFCHWFFSMAFVLLTLLIVGHEAHGVLDTDKYYSIHYTILTISCRYLAPFLAGLCVAAVAPKRGIIGIIAVYLFLAAVYMFKYWAQVPTTLPQMFSHSLFALAWYGLPYVSMGALVRRWLFLKRSKHLHS